MAAGDREREMTSTCERVRELLPWYLHGSLETEEGEAVAGHLESCSDCRRELDDTARVAWIADRHVPTEVLADYAFGTPIEGFDRGILERHLAHCPSCREELSLARQAASGSSERDVGSVPVGSRWSIALAASVVLALGVAALWWVGQTGSGATPQPSGDVALVELLPDSLALRGQEDSRVVPADRPVTLVLVTDVVLEETDDLRARLVSPEGDVLWEVTDLRPTPEGIVVIHLPESLPAPGPQTIELERRAGGEWKLVESYRAVRAP